MRNRRVHFVFVHGVDMDRMVRSWWEVYDSRKDQSIVVVVVTASNFFATGVFRRARSSGGGIDE